jgi:hypothetical protein
MRNWSTDAGRIAKDLRIFKIWQLEQQLNYGLDEGEFLERESLEKYLPELNIDRDTRNLMEFLLYDRRPTHKATAKVS